MLEAQRVLALIQIFIAIPTLIHALYIVKRTRLGRMLQFLPDRYRSYVLWITGVCAVYIFVFYVVISLACATS